MRHARNPIVAIMFAAICLLATPVMATSIFFTDRTAFNAVVGDTTAITFDSPAVWTPHTYPDGTINYDFGTLTQSGFLTAGGDREISVGVNSIPGAFCFCSTFGAGGWGVNTIYPVLAIAADFTPLQPNALISFGGAKFILSEPQFIGVLFSEPSGTYIGESFGLTSPEASPFFIENLTIKAVPEPASALLLGVGFFTFHCGRKVFRGA